jgi:uncharacterized protein
MLWRLLILTVLLIIVYFMVKSALRGLFGTKPQQRSVGSPPAAEMVQDPICGMYVPKEGAYFLRQGSLTHFFCSEACRVSYVKTLT